MDNANGTIESTSNNVLRIFLIEYGHAFYDGVAAVPPRGSR